MRQKISPSFLIVAVIAIAAAGIVAASASAEVNKAAQVKMAPAVKMAKAAQAPLCVAVGVAGSIVRSTDLGATWTAAASGTDRTFLSVTHVRGGIFAASGDRGTMRLSTDDGRTWTALAPPGGAGIDYWGIASDGAERLVAVGNGGRVVASTDLGKTWRDGASGVTNNLYGIAYAKPRFIAVGSAIILASADGGSTWSAANQPSNLRYYDAATDGKSRVLVCGGGPGGIPNIPGIILGSTDGGLVFTKSNFTSNYWMFGIGGNGQGTWMAVGGTLAYAAISVNDGASWTISQILTTNKTPKAVAHAGGAVWLAPAFSGAVFRTIDNGKNWSEVSSGVSETLNDIAIRK